MADDSQDLKALGQRLAVSYRVVVQAGKQTVPEDVDAHLQQLSEHGSRLPVAWFTPQLQEALLKLTETALRLNSPETDAHRLTAALRLWSFWIRRLGEFHNSPYLEVVVSRALDALDLAIRHDTLWSLVEPCTTTLAVSIGKVSDELEQLIAGWWQTWLLDAREKHRDRDLTFIYPCVAQILRSARQTDTIESTSAAFLRSWYTAPKDSAGWAPRMEDAVQIYRLYQHVLDLAVREQTNTSTTEMSASERKRRALLQKDAEQRMRALCASFENAAEYQDPTISVCAFIGACGVLRSPFMAEASAAHRRQTQQQVWTRITNLVENIEDLDRSDAFAFGCGQVLPSLGDFTRDASDYKAHQSIEDTLLVLYNYIFRAPAALSFDFLPVLTQELRQRETEAESTISAQSLLEQKTNHPIFNELGRISRGIATLIGQATEETENICLERYSTFAQQLLEAWSNCPWSMLNDTTPTEHKETYELLWKYFKIVIFSITMISTALVRRPMTADRAGRLLCMFRDVYFITCRLGQFTAYQEVLLVIATSLREQPQVFAETVQYISLPPGPLEGNHARRARIVFYLDFIEQHLDILSDELLASLVLPIAHPYLETHTYRDTFASAHSVLLEVFVRRKAMAQELAPYYSELLLKSYPNLITIEQLRHAYTTMVDCLSEQDEAYAWFVVQRLIDAIDAIPPMTAAEKVEHESLPEPAEQATALARGHLLITLCDQVRVISLAQLDRLLSHVRRFLLAEAPSAARTAVVKILFDNVSQQLDFTRKERVAKWYMELAAELGLPGAL